MRWASYSSATTGTPAHRGGLDAPSCTRRSTPCEWSPGRITGSPSERRTRPSHHSCPKASQCPSRVAAKVSPQRSSEHPKLPAQGQGRRPPVEARHVCGVEAPPYRTLGAERQGREVSLPQPIGLQRTHAWSSSSCGERIALSTQLSASSLCPMPKGGGAATGSRHPS